MNPSKPLLTIEEQILTDLVSPNSNNQLTNINSFPKNFNWRKFLYDSRFHEVSPFLFFQSRKLVNFFPKQVFECLQLDFYRNVVYNKVKLKELSRILKLLAAKGIFPVVYKGAILSSYAYGDYSIRKYSDVDLLINLKWLKGISEILETEGYTIEENFTHEQRLKNLENGKTCNFNLFTPRGNFRIHLENHFKLAGPELSLSFDLNDFMFPPEARVIDKFNILAPSLEDTLVTMSIHHGGKDKWLRLKNICDLAWMIHRHGHIIQWDLVINKSKQIGTLRILLSGSHLAQNLFKVTLPEILKKEVEADHKLVNVSNHIIRQLFAKDRLYKPDALILSLRLRERAIDRLKIMWYRLQRILSNHEADKKLLKLPESLSFLYYLIKPIRLLKDQTWKK